MTPCPCPASMNTAWGRCSMICAATRSASSILSRLRNTAGGKARRPCRRKMTEESWPKRATSTPRITGIPAMSEGRQTRARASETRSMGISTSSEEAEKSHSISCRHALSESSRRRRSTSSRGRASVSSTRNMSAVQFPSPSAFSFRARSYSSENRFTPLGVPMNSARPWRSASAGWMISSHSSRFICATSSRITPSKYMPRRASGLSAPNSRSFAPLGSRTESSPSFTTRPGTGAE